VLINSVLSSLPMFMISFFEVQKGFLKKLITSALYSSSSMTARRKSIDLLNGVSYANQKTKWVYGLKI
jgi:hypothetical protein